MVLKVSFSTSLKRFTNFPILYSILLQVAYLVQEHNTFSHLVYFTPQVYHEIFLEHQHGQITVIV